MHIDRVAIGEAVDLHLLVCIRNVGAQMLDRRPDGEPFVMRCVRRQVCDIVQEYGANSLSRKQTDDSLQ